MLSAYIKTVNESPMAKYLNVLSNINVGGTAVYVLYPPARNLDLSIIVTF